MSRTMNLDDKLLPDVTTTGSAAVRSVRFVCPLCAKDCDGSHVEDPSGSAWVQCHECSYRCDPGVLDIPTEAMLAKWHAQALRHGQTAVRCADGTPTCSYLAIVWCRRLAPELSLWGKSSFLDRVTRPLAGFLAREQREVVVQLGLALQMPPATINRVLDAA